MGILPMGHPCKGRSDCEELFEKNIQTRRMVDDRDEEAKDLEGVLR